MNLQESIEQQISSESNKEIQTEVVESEVLGEDSTEVIT